MKIVLFAAGAFVTALAAGTGIAVLTAPKPVAVVADSLLAAPDSAQVAADSAHATADSAHAAPPVTPDPATVAHGAAPRASEPATGAHGAAPRAGEPATAGHAAAGNTAAPNAAAVKPATAAPAPPAAPPGAALAATSNDDAGYRQVARVLSNMKPTDAAAIVAHLSDDQLDGVLRQLGVRQAASLMGALPVERAAAMSRRMIKQPPKTEAR